ncbi:hypothetical protein ACK1CN_02695 [Vibrio coralliilyticus]|uniref:hypothetical protein n=1 Tax=Vibrio coralliilyticus TaxID=190893 RepID=UPI00391738F4
MARKKSAPKGNIKEWNSYLKWLDKKGKQGKFAGYLDRLANLNAPIIASNSVFSNVTVADKGGWYESHPWATDGLATQHTNKVMLTPHHLITCEVMKSLTEHFRNVIEQDIGYNVNCPQNLVILPNSTTVACYLGVPPHEGGHDYGKRDSSRYFQLAANSKINGEKLWQPNVHMKAYHAKVFKVLTPVIHRYFRCKKDLDHNEFIEELNLLSKKILKKLGNFQWLLHEFGADYAPGNNMGCRNTELISTYAQGDDRKHLRESAKKRSINDPDAQLAPCEYKRLHPDMEDYFIKKENKLIRKRKGLKVASEVQWI